jgi:hypothetical protein
LDKPVELEQLHMELGFERNVGFARGRDALVLTKRVAPA